MTAGLNRARASCAAASSEGSMSSSVRSNWQAASQEIGVAPAFANSAAVADSASERKVAMSLYFETCPIRTRRKSRPALATIILAVMLAIILATIIADLANPCLSSFRENIRALKADRYAPPPLPQHTAKVVNISTLDNVNSWE